jgi:hypothetical protein
MPGERALASRLLRTDDLRQSIEKGAHPWREPVFESREGPRQLLVEGRSCKTVERCATEVERAQLDEAEAGIETCQAAHVDPPSQALAAGLLEERESRSFERRKIAADRPRRHALFAGKGVNGQTVAGGGQGAKDLPLTDDFSAAGHDGSLF